MQVAINALNDEACYDSTSNLYCVYTYQKVLP